MRRAESLFRLQSGLADAEPLLFWRISWRVRSVFWFSDRRHAIHIEFLVVGIARDGVDLEALHQEDANANVGFFVSRKPDFVINVGLLENKARSLLQIGHEAAAEAE